MALEEARSRFNRSAAEANLTVAIANMLHSLPADVTDEFRDRLRAAVTMASHALLYRDVLSDQDFLDLFRPVYKFVKTLTIAPVER